jgi:hypothetical protein
VNLTRFWKKRAWPNLIQHPGIWRSCDRASWHIIKPTRCTNFLDLFWKKSLHVSDSSSVHHQEFFPVHTAIVYVIQVCWHLASRIRLILLSSCQQNCMTYTTVVYTVKNSWRWSKELSETCTFSFQNKFEKLVRLGGFIIRSILVLPVRVRWRTHKGIPSPTGSTGQDSNQRVPKYKSEPLPL